ncbi:unnamed protein product [Protopolystoma xenopodis]|uniref:Uncharacterized protein n=1 Tax=Protopolystoma xenopodis TaxID=117903 RepID=A0A3S5AP18_9PLAT|nr:unnamed protein product [Protopolystoma xenopodis]
MAAIFAISLPSIPVPRYGSDLLMLGFILHHYLLSTILLLPIYGITGLQTLYVASVPTNPGMQTDEMSRTIDVRIRQTIFANFLQLTCEVGGGDARLASVMLVCPVLESGICMENCTRPCPVVDGMLSPGKPYSN